MLQLVQIVQTEVHVWMISNPLEADTAVKVKLPKLTPTHPGLAPTIWVAHPELTVVQPETVPFGMALVQPLHNGIPAQSLYIFIVTLYIPAVEVHW